MSWETTHSICDLPIGQKANMQGNISFGNLGIVAGDLTTAATASASAIVANALEQICDQCMGYDAPRGFVIADNMDFTFASTTAAFTASGPEVNCHKACMLH